MDVKLAEQAEAANAVEYLRLQQHNRELVLAAFAWGVGKADEIMLGMLLKLDKKLRRAKARPHRQNPVLLRCGSLYRVSRSPARSPRPSRRRVQRTLRP